MLDMNLSAVADIELATKAQIKLQEIGIDIKAVMNGFLKELTKKENLWDYFKKK